MRSGGRDCVWWQRGRGEEEREEEEKGPFEGNPTVSGDETGEEVGWAASPEWGEREGEREGERGHITAEVD